MNIEIITIISKNYGNRLQNYALQEYLKKLGMKVRTSRLHQQNYPMLRKIRDLMLHVRRNTDKDLFNYFDTKISWKKSSLPIICDDNQIDYYIAGSDQIWNPLFEFNSEREFLTFAAPQKRVAYAASIGIEELPKELQEKYKQNLLEFKKISVRENAGKRIIQEVCGIDVPVVIDPTMLLTEEDWRKVIKSSVLKIRDPYVVKYFLGIRNDEYDIFIEQYAKKHKCRIIDITKHQESGIRGIGPCEFLDLFSNCQASFVDSFHGTVFSILFGKQFLTFSRPNEVGYGNMNSRFETILGMLGLENHYVNSITDTDKIYDAIDYKEVHRIIQSERAKAEQYLRKALVK